MLLRCDDEGLALLGPIIALRDAWCPAHGRVRPDVTAYPFSITLECLTLFPPVCGAGGCGETIMLDAERLDAPLRQHLLVWDDPECGQRIVRDVLPVAPGIWAEGVTPYTRDHPSGAAPDIRPLTAMEELQTAAGAL
jgi:hypothetical protein